MWEMGPLTQWFLCTYFSCLLLHATHTGNDGVAVREVPGRRRIWLQGQSVSGTQPREKLRLRGFHQQHSLPTLLPRPEVGQEVFRSSSSSFNPPPLSLLSLPPPSLSYLYSHRYIFAGLSSGSVAVLATHYWLDLWQNTFVFVFFPGFFRFCIIACTYHVSICVIFRVTPRAPARFWRKANAHAQIVPFPAHRRRAITAEDPGNAIPKPLGDATTSFHSR